MTYDAVITALISTYAIGYFTGIGFAYFKRVFNSI